MKRKRKWGGKEGVGEKKVRGEWRKSEGQKSLRKGKNR